MQYQFNCFTVCLCKVYECVCIVYLHYLCSSGLISNTQSSYKLLVSVYVDAFATHPLSSLETNIVGCKGWNYKFKISLRETKIEVICCQIFDF